MALFRITASTVGVMMLCVLVNGFTPGPAPGCNLARIDAGYPYDPHQTYCELFYHCNAGLTQFTQLCAPGTLYSTDSVCVPPEQSVCVNWQCDSTTIGEKYPALCCESYYECTGSGFRKMDCEGSLVFDMESETCVNDQTRCTDHKLCKRPGTSSDNDYVCYDLPDEAGDPCKYRTKFATIDIKNRPCGAGSEFNDSSCSCSILNPQCLLDRTVEKEADPLCQATMMVDFTSLPLRATSERRTDGLSPYHVRLFGVSLGSNEAIFRPDPVTGGQPYIYVYYFNSNVWKTPWGFVITFRADSTASGSNTFTLVTNNYNNVCSPTFEVNVTVSSNSVEVNAYGMGVTGLTGTASGSLNVARGRYVEIVVTYNAVIGGKITDLGTSGNNRGSSADLTQSNALGDTLMVNKCGLVFGRGLNGVIRKLNVYEGCGNLSLL